MSVIGAMHRHRLLIVALHSVLVDVMVISGRAGHLPGVRALTQTHSLGPGVVGGGMGLRQARQEHAASVSGEAKPALRGVGVEGPEAGDNEISDEQEDIGLSMTTNNELRLCGMTGDDEDDVAGDVEELFGHRAAEELYGRTAAHPVPIDDTDAPNTGGAVQDDATADDGFSSRPNHPSTSSNAISSVAITSDIWSGNAKEDYLSVVGHYINADWQLIKRVLGLRLIDASHNADNIVERVSNVLNDYSILKKALVVVSPMLDAFRTAISFINSSNQRVAAYKSYCMASGIRPRKFGLDMEVRWNSTYLMLRHLLPHKETFHTFIESNYPRKRADPFLLTHEHWAMATKILEFLELLYDSIVALFGVYYPTAPLMIHHVVKIAIHLHRYQNDEHIRTVVQPMIDKYNKYWRTIHELYCIAFILDSRAKIKGFNKVLRKLNLLTDADYSNKMVETRTLLFKLYHKYDDLYGSVRAKRPDPPSLSGKKRTAWAEIYDDDDGGGLLGAGCSSLPPNLDMSRTIPATTLLHAASSSNTGSELSAYLDCDTVSQIDDDFNILNWWHQHKLTYLVFSTLARDVFSVPVSIISSEATFSTTGRIIEDRRRRLNPKTMEALTCIKD
ncbi:zinc finger BED domain-containing protein RICESLEEPER 2-like [Miscanthus floridulus]|uniref:zinc finger BED domain-containing protein RICESLEEPER 2-like n=1 Tax=Miscanthus floridulus TaxID=154761 RepID=UPI003458A031